MTKVSFQIFKEKAAEERDTGGAGGGIHIR